MKSAPTATGNLAPSLDAASLAHSITKWYRQNKRELPWRISQDPYRIWISEVMLQQTTVTAVIPFYEKFMLAFPTVQALAKAPLQKVLENWSGLGYYSRARNLHKAALVFAEKGFPRTAAELQELPGLGPYTSRAIAALAFGEKVGVLDGNVIRVLSRLTGEAVEHWKPAGRAHLQILADKLAQFKNPSDFNQALMELGATICTPHRPTCLLCPWNKSCLALRQDRIAELPLKKPRKDFEIWFWQPEIMMQKGRVALVQNAELPFLKGHWVFPGKIKRLARKPEKFDLRHGITHHDIYVQVRTSSSVASQKDLKWCSPAEIASVNPSILLRKVLDTGLR